MIEIVLLKIVGMEISGAGIWRHEIKGGVEHNQMMEMMDLLTSFQPSNYQDIRFWNHHISNRVTINDTMKFIDYVSISNGFLIARWNRFIQGNLTFHIREFVWISFQIILIF